MDILGIGPLEFLFILLIALIVLGPRDMVKVGRTIGRFLNRVVSSPTWRAIRKTAQELRQLPTYLMRETNLEDALRELPTPETVKRESGFAELSTALSRTNEDISDWLRPPTAEGKAQQNQQTGTQAQSPERSTE